MRPDPPRVPRSEARTLAVFPRSVDSVELPLRPPSPAYPGRFEGFVILGRPGRGFFKLDRCHRKLAPPPWKLNRAHDRDLSGLREARRAGMGAAWKSDAPSPGSWLPRSSRRLRRINSCAAPAVRG